MRFIDLTGQKFNRLTVIKRAEDHIEPSGRKIIMWLCKCECGNFTKVRTSDLKLNKHKSCGCLRSEKSIKINTKHGKRHTRLYNIWAGIKSRCLNENFPQYKDYGGRGIKICNQWLNDFGEFYNWSMQNGYKKNLTIDRINVNGNYEPSNCRWATCKQQSNNKRNNRMITYKGETLSLMKMAERYNAKWYLLRNYLNKGTPIELAIKESIKR